MAALDCIYYLSNGLKFKERNESINVAESLFIETIIPNKKIIIVGIIYRPLDKNVDLFTNDIAEKSLEKINRVT